MRTTRGWDNLQNKGERKPLFFLPQIRKSGVISDSFCLQTATNPFSPTPKRKGTWLNDMSDREHQLKAMSLTSISNVFFLLLYEHLFLKITGSELLFKVVGKRVKQKFLKSPIFWWCKMVMAQFIPWDDESVQSHQRQTYKSKVMVSQESHTEFATNKSLPLTLR